MVVSAAVFAVAAPFAKAPLARLDAFIPGYESALVLGDLVTATLLFGQLRYFRSRALLALACGYLFTALMALAHLLTFPGLFPSEAWLGAGPQSTAWLYMLWHAGFPLFVIGYALVPGEFDSPDAVLWAIVCTLAGGGLCTFLATAGHDTLPAIMSGNRYTPLMLTTVTSVWVLSVAALAILWRRRPRTVLDAWLMVVSLAWVFDIALSAVLNAGRFDLGFYAGRIYGLVAATLVMVVLLLENGRLYARLREKNRQLDLARRDAQQAEAAKSAFLATMSHEVRTPMTGVMGMLELLSLTRLDGEQRTTLAIIRESGRSLLRIVDDILDFSKLEAGKLELRPEPTSIATLVERVRDSYSGNASAKGLAITHSVDPRISVFLAADPVRLAQILNNLVSNAIKFTTQGEVAVRAERIAHDGKSEIVRFVVEDTGAGIAPEDRANLFQPFVQAGRGDAGGTGLGLSICRRLAGLMNGELQMESELGVGTKVWLTVTLPLADPPRAAPAPDPAAPAGPVRKADPFVGRPSGQHRVLVVDDHRVNRMVLVKQLESLGYAAETAADGIEAIDRWSAGGIAALITDCQMPELNGFELARHVRAVEERHGGSRLPIIACTANAMAGERARCVSAGMDDYLVKPVSLDGLRRAMQQWLPLPQPIDPELLAELSDGDADAERELLSQFWSFNGADQRALADAVALQDCPATARAAHRVKGASRAVGAEALAEVCERLESAGRNGDWLAVRALMGQLDHELERLRVHIATLEPAP